MGASHISKKAADQMITNFLKSGAAQAFIENIAKETFLLFKTRIEKGKVTGADFEQAFLKAATAGLLKGGMGKAIQGFNKASPKSTKLVVGKIVYSKYLKGSPDVLRKLYPDEANLTKILTKNGDAIAQNIGEKISGKTIETAVLNTFAKANGSESEKTLTQMFEAEMRKSKSLHKEIDALMAAEVGKRYKKLEKAK